MRRSWAYAAIAILPVAGGGLYLASRVSPPTLSSETPRSQPKPEAATPEQVVREGAKSKDPKVVDRVGRARIALAYRAAKNKDWQGARAQLRLAAKTKGTGAMSADFGSVADQAAYQMAVCLVAEGRKAEAEREFVRFLEERPLSPLVHAVHGRLRRLSGGTKPEWDALLQRAVAKQEAYIRFETSVCGPKVLARMLPMIGRPAKDYKELAKLCGTTDQGTTLEGMRKGLERLGVTSYGIEVDRKAFLELQTPFVMLEDDHYVLVTRVEPFRADVYDPRLNAERKWSLPALGDDRPFNAIVLATSLPASLAH